MNPKKYVQQFNVIKKRFDNDLKELGLRIRDEVVAPACKDHGLKFLSGNGTFFFTKGKKTYGDTSRYDEALATAPKALRERLNPIIDLLNTEVTHNDCLGFYVGEVLK